MKSSETKMTASNLHQAKQQENAPFFKKDRTATFFSEAQADIQPFFQTKPKSETTQLSTSNYRLATNKPFLQAKLKIDQPNNKYEQEADSVADKVVQRLSEAGNGLPADKAGKPETGSVTPVSGLPSPASVQTKCAECKVEEQEQQEDIQPKEESIQRKPIFESAEDPPEDFSTSGSPDIQRKCATCEQDEAIQPKRISDTSTATPDLENRLNSSKGGGSPLPKDTRSNMESVMGADFSGVRVHTGSSAVQMNQELGAQAFTHGSDIYFNRGKYETNSFSGKHLLAHELAHTVQQGGHNNFLQKQNQCFPTYNEEEQICEAPVSNEAFGQDEAVISSLTSTGSYENLISDYLIEPTPDEPYVQFDSIKLTANQSLCRTQLLYLYHHRGEEDTHLFIELFAYAITGQSFYTYTEEERTLGRQILPVLREEFRKLVEERDRFAQLVKDAAVVKLNQNREALAQWRAYVENLQPMQTYAQAYTVQTRGLYNTSQETRHVGPYSTSELFESWTQMQSPHERRRVEQLIRGEIRGGCGDCHSRIYSEYATNRDRDRGLDYGLNWQAPRTIFPQLAENARTNPSPVPNIQNRSNRNVSSQGTTNTYDLQNFNQGRYPGTYTVLDAMNRIRTYIEPLGPDGYQVIPREIFLDARTPEEVVQAVIEKIEERRDQYAELIRNIENGEVSYTKLQGILEMLYPIATQTVQLMINADIEHKTRRQRERDSALTILGIAALLLTVFPPTAPIGIAMDLGLAAYGIMEGFETFSEGYNYGLGTYSGVFTREQEEAADMLMTMGIIQTALSVVGVATSGATIARLTKSVITRGGRTLAVANNVAGRVDDATFEILGLSNRSSARVIIRNLAEEIIVDTSLNFLIEGAVNSLAPGSEDRDVAEPLFSEEHPGVVYLSGEAHIQMGQGVETAAENGQADIRRQTDFDQFETSVRQSMRRGSFGRQFGWPEGGMDHVIQGKYRGRSGWGFDAIGIFHHPNGNISIYIVEVKYSLDPSLGRTLSGTQMGRGWIRDKLEGIIRYADGGDAASQRTYRLLVEKMGLSHLPDSEARRIIRRKIREIPDTHLAVAVRRHADLGSRRTTAGGASRGRGMGQQLGGLSSSGSRIRVGRHGR